MKIGDRIRVSACKTDGTVYRSWHATVESMDADLIVTVAPAGSEVEHKAINGKSSIAHHMRAYYWLDKFYNLIEVFETNGELSQLYINIASPPEFENGMMSFKDHELDVSKVPPNEAKIIDEDEFAEAVEKYQYSAEFQEKMYSTAREAVELANHWVARPAPTFGDEHD